MSAKNKANEVETTGEVYNLLAGYEDKEGAIHKEFEITELTGAEEEAISKPDIKVNGGKVIRTILERCCVRIGSLTKAEMGLTKWREVIQGLFTGDQDYMLLKIREASVGTEIEAAHECPGCKAKLKTTIATDELEVKEFNGQREIEFELPKGYKDKNGNIHRNGKLRLPTGLDRELLDPAAKKNLGEGNTLMLVRCIVDLDGLPCVTPEMIRSLVLKDRNYLFDLFKENMFGLVLESDVTCDSCQREFRASLNATNFL